MQSNREASQLAAESLAKLTHYVNQGTIKYISYAALADSAEDRAHALSFTTHSLWNVGTECKVIETLLKRQPELARSHGMEINGQSNRQFGHLRVTLKPTEWRVFTAEDLKPAYNKVIEDAEKEKMPKSEPASRPPDYVFSVEELMEKSRRQHLKRHGKYGTVDVETLCAEIGAQRAEISLLSTENRELSIDLAKCKRELALNRRMFTVSKKESGKKEVNMNKTLQRLRLNLNAAFNRVKQAEEEQSNIEKVRTRLHNSFLYCSYMYLMMHFFCNI
jgi:regulator of replication initiation timing